MVLLCGAAGAASADERAQFQDRGPGESDKYQAWSHGMSAPVPATKAIAPGTREVTGDTRVVTRVAEDTRATGRATVTEHVRIADDGGGVSWKTHDKSHGSNSHSLRAPEIDPATLVVGLTLLAGGLAVFRARAATNNPAG